ncbi:MAG: phosphotransferase [Ilumatobacteraceae bacterium]
MGQLEDASCPSSTRSRRGWRPTCPSSRASRSPTATGRFGNCLVDVSAGRIAAVLDWELRTLGDPLADVGYLGVYWVKGDGEGRHNDFSSAPGFPPYEDLVAPHASGGVGTSHRLLRRLLALGGSR